MQELQKVWGSQRAAELADSSILLLLLSRGVPSRRALKEPGPVLSKVAKEKGCCPRTESSPEDVTGPAQVRRTEKGRMVLRLLGPKTAMR